MYLIPNHWTEEQVEKLKVLFKEGLSYKQIAIELHKTRNAISGKVDRLGLDRIKVVVEEPKVPTQPKVKKHKMRTRLEIINPPQIPKLGQCDVMELHSGRCHWPLWPNTGITPVSEKFYCGEITGGFPYCADHAKLSYSMNAPSSPFRHVRRPTKSPKSMA
jgi:hypothetical protein